MKTRLTITILLVTLALLIQAASRAWGVPIAGSQPLTTWMAMVIRMFLWPLMATIGC